MTIKFIRKYLVCANPGCSLETDRGYLVRCGICVFHLCWRCGKRWKRSKGGAWMNNSLFEFHQFALYMGTWILGWTMLFYSAGAGLILALRGKKTSLQKVMALCGTGLVVMMWIVAK